jgi:hypothetical protein
MGPRCGQLALAVGNVPALRVHFSLLIANWQRYALTPLLIVIFSSLPFRVFRFCSRFSFLNSFINQHLSPLIQRLPPNNVRYCIDDSCRLSVRNSDSLPGCSRPSDRNPDSLPGCSRPSDRNPDSLPGCSRLSDRNPDSLPGCSRPSVPGQERLPACSRPSVPDRKSCPTSSCYRKIFFCQ